MYTDRINKMTSSELNNVKRLRWTLLAIVGFLTGFIAFCIAILVKKLIKLRFEHTIEMLDEGHIAGGYFYFTGLAVIYIAIATVAVNFIQPAATGSGLPQLKAFLNGVNIPNFLQLDTLAVKVVGVIFSVASGITCGKEGPLVHTGSMIASRTSHLPRVHKLLDDPRAKIFRNDFDRRNFVSSGAAAGVAAAFGAPIGGVLFSLEEASSFWSLPLTWGVFFTAMISTFTVNILMSAHKGDIDAVNDPGLITFGSFVVQPYRLFEIPIFALIAVFGGLLGALFNFLNIYVNRWRKEFFKKGTMFDSDFKVKLAKCAEAMFVAWFTATMFYWIPYAMRHSCKEESEATDACGAIFDQTYVIVCMCSLAHSLTHPPLNVRYENYLCENKTEYNSMATLMLQPQEEVIEALFHDYTPAGEFAFRPGDLVVYCILYFFISAYTFGVSVPAGLFVPCILCGSSFGRLVGEAVRTFSLSLCLSVSIYYP